MDLINNHPAFPVLHDHKNTGMSLYDYYLGRIAAGLMPHWEEISDCESECLRIAEIADCMAAQLLRVRKSRMSRR